MDINNGQITKFSVTKGGDIWIDVDEDIFYDIKDSDWEDVFLYPDTKGLRELLPYWYPGCDDDEYDEDENPYSFEWLKRVVICCVEKTKPIETLHQIYLYIINMEIVYTGESYEEDDPITGWQLKNFVEIGDEGWENYYYIHVFTSPKCI